MPSARKTAKIKTATENGGRSHHETTRTGHRIARYATTVSTGPFTIDELALMVEENMVTKDEFKRLEDKVESGFAILDRKLDHFLGVVRGDYDQLATRVKRLEDTIFRA